MEEDEEVERYLKYADAVATMVIENGADEDEEVVAELMNAMVVLRAVKKVPV